MNPVILEWFGYAASVVVAISLTMSSIIKLRWLNFAGATMFSVYGFLIKAYPVGLLNAFIALADIYYLYKIYTSKDDFRLIPLQFDDLILKDFLESQAEDIREIFPDFELPLYSESLIFMILRNHEPAGVVYGVLDEKGGLNIQMDYAAPRFRDFKPGKFFYESSRDLLKNKGIQRIFTQKRNSLHQKYLQKMGFYRDEDSGLFIKNL